MPPWGGLTDDMPRNRKPFVYVLCESVGKFICFNNQHLPKFSLEMGQGIWGIKDARKRINGEARKEIIQCNYMLWLFYQNKHTNHPKNYLHLILYGLSLLVSYRNSLCCIIITTSLLL